MNIMTLKNGGVISEKELSPLPDTLLQNWELVDKSFIVYKYSIEEIRNNTVKETFTDNDFTGVKEKADELVQMSDVLVNALSKHSEGLSEFLIELQNILMLINIVLHVLLILIIIRILHRESRKMVELDRLATVGLLASKLGHDIRNPLSVIKNTVAIMRNKYGDNVDEKTNSHFSRIEWSISSIQNQIQDALDFVKISPLHLDSNSLLKILDSALKTLVIPENIKINLPQNDLIIICDNKRLEVVFANLITNSIQAIKNGGEINIRIIDKTNVGLIEIEDMGTGIPEDLLPNIFEPLFTTKQTGTGLGLASCKNIVEQHLGTITVKNNPTTFTVRLPKSL